MCIIVYKPLKEVLDLEVLKICQEANEDGMGFALVKNKELLVEKEMEKLDELWKKYKDITGSHEKKHSVIWHFRTATHGEKSLLNCHPFLLENKEYAFAHNGVIASNIDNKAKESDTLLFKQNILDNIPNDFYKNDAMVKLVRSYIGLYSKLAFLNKNGEVFLMGQEAGTWDKNIWYSNTGYKPIVSTPAYSHSTYNGRRIYDDQEYNFTTGRWETTPYSKQSKLSSLIKNRSQTTDTSHLLTPSNICLGCGQPVVRLSEMEFGHCSWCMEHLRIDLPQLKGDNKDDYTEYVCE